MKSTSACFISSFGSNGLANSAGISTFRSAGATIQEFEYYQYNSANSIQLAATTTTATTAFEPMLPDTSTLIGFGILTVLCVLCAVVWNNDVVPVSRRKLALSKSRGEVKEYLDDLRASASSRPLETWMFQDWLNKASGRKPSAIPFLKDAKWNSGDNPVVVTAAIMMVGIVVASVTERMTT